MDKHADQFILALDQGTTSARAILFDRRGGIHGVAQQEITQHFPQPGWVEHDANEIWQAQLAVAQAVLRDNAIAAKQIAAVGITNQRETTVLWDRASGQPLHRGVNPVLLVALGEAAQAHQRRARALAFDQRIGGQRRPVHDERDISGLAVRFGEDGAHPFQHGALRCVGRGQDLGGMGCCAGFQHDIGEGAADIDGQTRRHYSSSLMLPLRTTSPQVTESRFRKAA